ncbi:MAG: TIGR02391 family protein [Thermodesulfobacteriota bacterium]
MNIPRPIPKEILKKLYLKKLLGLRQRDGKYRNHRVVEIIDKIPVNFRITSLDINEEYDAKLAVFELEQEGYVIQDPEHIYSTYPDQYKILTEKGMRVAQQDFEEMKFPLINIDQLLTNDELREKVRNEFISDDFESATFKAFKLLEEKVRFKAGLQADKVGEKLMLAAFKPEGGILRHPDAQTGGEIEGFHYLMRGAMMWFKNPPSHRTVIYDKAEQAAHVLAFANLLLDMVDQCQKVEP